MIDSRESFTSSPNKADTSVTQKDDIFEKLNNTISSSLGINNDQIDHHHTLTSSTSPSPSSSSFISQPIISIIDNSQVEQESTLEITNSNSIVVEDHPLSFDDVKSSTTLPNQVNILKSSIDPSLLVDQTNKTFSLAGNVKSDRSGKLIEHFIVIGLSSINNINPNDKISHDGKLLYSYPPDYRCDQQVINFCFPDGIKLLQVRRRSSLTEIHAVLFKSLSQLEGSDTSFMFLVTGGEELLYAACVLNTEPVDEPPCFFMQDNPDGSQSPSPGNQSPPLNPREAYARSNSKVCIFAPRCYCVISKYPFFKVHFDFIYSILGKERLNRINSILERPPQSTSTKLSMSSSNDLGKYSNQRQQLNPPILPPRSSLPQSQVFPSLISPPTLSKSTAQARLGITKPLPPIPSQSPLVVSPSESSPLFSYQSETTSLLVNGGNNLGNNFNLNNNINNNNDNRKDLLMRSHSRSYSSPLQTLPVLQQQSITRNIPIINRNITTNNTNSFSSLSSSGSGSGSGSSGSGSLDDSLSAIQESLGMSDQMTEFTSSNSSIDFQDSPSNQIQFGDFSPAIINSNTNLINDQSITPITQIVEIKDRIIQLDNRITDQSSMNHISSSLSTLLYSNLNNSNGSTTSSNGSRRSLIDSSPLITDTSCSLVPESLQTSGEVEEVDLRLSMGSNTNSPYRGKPLPKIPDKYINAELTSPSASHPPMLQISSPIMESTSHPLSSIQEEGNTTPPPPPPRPPKPTTNNLSSSSKSRELANEEIEIIKYYCSLMVPKDDERFSIQPPGEQQPTNYVSGDDTAQIENWCLGGLMRTLSLRTIMQVVSCILLEKYLIITSKNIGLISNTIFALIPLLRPLVYQGAFIPILPQSTLDVLHCPIPYVIGITKLPTDMAEALDNCYIVDVDENKMVIGKNCQPLPHFPLEDKLESSLKCYHSMLWKENGRKYALDYPFKIIQNDYKHITNFSNEFKNYNRFIIDSVAYYIDWNNHFDFGNKEHKDQLFKLFNPQHLHFMNHFLSTQLFTSHTELLFDVKNKYKAPNDPIQLNPYKSNKL